MREETREGTDKSQRRFRPKEGRDKGKAGGK